MEGWQAQPDGVVANKQKRLSKLKHREKHLCLFRTTLVLRLAPWVAYNHPVASRHPSTGGELYRHAGDGLVGLDQFVSYLNRTLKANAGFLHINHDIVQRYPRFAHNELFGLDIGGLLGR